MWLKGQGFDYLNCAAAMMPKTRYLLHEKKYMATTVTIDDRQYTFVKGAPES
jgi:Ca2+-transporting ATPase